RLLRAGEAAGAVSTLAAARRRQDRAAEDLAEAHRMGARLVTPEDREWPDTALHPMLLAYARERPTRRSGEASGSGEPGEKIELTPPLALWALGEARLDAAFARAVGVVGSRSATPYGLHVAGTIGSDLARRGWAVVSGGAFGIDAAAHRGALAAEGLTIAIVAGGLLRPYPRSHEQLFGRIARDGLLVSEFPPDATPQRHRFLVRNRLVAGLTAGVVVVEAGLRSGSLATARQALRMDRVVMGVPGPVTSHESAGVHELLRGRPETVLVTRAAEVVEAVGAFGADLAERRQAPPVPRDALAPLARQILDGLPTTGAASPDRIAVACGVPPLDVLRCLPALELKGFVEATPTGWRLTPTARSPR
ncbi:MAG TPA: DNA-processing protein DprA, partial [Mycobacteriales bacterium]|nr:DNA-processing protein DprA [Mycobacteriales bacterium]